MTLFATRTEHSGPSYVDDYRDGLHLGGFEALRQEVAADASKDPNRFVRDLVASGVPADEAVESVRTLLQDHLERADSMGSTLVAAVASKGDVAV